MSAGFKKSTEIILYINLQLKLKLLLTDEHGR